MAKKYSAASIAETKRANAAAKARFDKAQARKKNSSGRGGRGGGGGSGG